MNSNERTFMLAVLVVLLAVQSIRQGQRIGRLESKPAPQFVCHQVEGRPAGELLCMVVEP